MVTVSNCNSLSVYPMKTGKGLIELALKSKLKQKPTASLLQSIYEIIQTASKGKENMLLCYLILPFRIGTNIQPVSKTLSSGKLGIKNRLT